MNPNTDPQGVEEQLRQKARASFETNKSFGRKGAQWAIETEVEWQAADTIESLRAELERVREALSDADYGLTGVIDDAFDEDRYGPCEDPCEAEELCGNRLCNAAGCLKNKRDSIRIALNREG